MIIKDWIGRLLEYRIVRFCIVGCAATLTHYAIYLILIKLGMAVWLAFSIGYLSGFLLNYILSSTFTFGKKASLGNGIGFVMSNVVNYFLQLLVLKGFIHLGMSEALAPVPMYCICVPINYLMVRFVFSRF